ncbi:protein tweety homolog [Elysia marginata]|uniref:Protein tweety homolog n=1 Tax=Elysia marginata TaxID=1093978 RepID=A0AAV4FXC7_9GAST|nr:protein tweety homolog [Elysia marginata]
MTTTSKVYDRSWISDYFHDFPHINFNFKKVNSTFNPENVDYVESLAILVLFPIAVSLVLCLVYLVYFFAHCLQKQSSQHRHKQGGSGCFTAFVFLLGLFIECLVGFGFFQNERADDGVDGVRHAVNNINATIATAKSSLTNLDAKVDEITGSLASALEASAGGIPDPKMKKKIIDMIEQMSRQTVSAKTDLRVVSKLDTCEEYLTDVHHYLQEYEYYRWAGTICIFVIYAGLFMCVLAALLKHWKGLLKVTAGFGVILAVMFWGFLGVYLSSSVGLSDFCLDPTAYFVKELTGSESSGELLMYMKCSDPSQPYQKIIVEAQNALTQANSVLDAIAQNTRPYGLPGFEETIKIAEDNIVQAQCNLSSILTNVGTCTVLHNHYITGVNSACHGTLQSVALLLLLAALLALLSAIMIFLISCLWRTYGKRQIPQYREADDTDPFLPRPPPYEPEYGSITRASPAAWSDRRALRAQHPSVNEEQVMFLRHQQMPGREDSPPPAYHSGQFSSQYLEAALSSNAGKPRN